MNDSIIDEVKRALGVDTEESDFRLCQLLKHKIAQTHPDNPNNGDPECVSEEECKKLTELYNRLKKYIDEKESMSKALSVPKESEMVLFQYMKDIDIKEETIKHLQSENAQLDMKLNDIKQQLKNTINELSQLRNTKVEESKKSIDKIFRPQKKYNAIGGSAFIATIAISIPQLKNLLVDIGIPTTAILVITVATTILWVARWIWNYIINGITDSVICEILNSPNLEEKLEVKSTYHNHSSYYYFSFHKLSSYIRCLLSQRGRKLFTVWKRERLVKSLTDHLVLELFNRGIIKDKKTNKLDVEFLIEKETYIF